MDAAKGPVPSYRTVVGTGGVPIGSLPGWLRVA